eukprot:TRINITY_DN9522_c0_g1_i1.p3 TRINITY_DN9522_c0_g1~~TRINITY_DN9522_c0_g1_i1.p3  ORF type:complete len:223 (+),score=67.50 TRINITY_DN9522_c0_g1_i1:913-1581(+)
MANRDTEEESGEDNVRSYLRKPSEPFFVLEDQLETDENTAPLNYNTCRIKGTGKVFETIQNPHVEVDPSKEPEKFRSPTFNDDLEDNFEVWEDPSVIHQISEGHLSSQNQALYEELKASSQFTDSIRIVGTNLLSVLNRVKNETTDAFGRPLVHFQTSATVHDAEHFNDVSSTPFPVADACARTEHDDSQLVTGSFGVEEDQFDDFDFVSALQQLDTFDCEV